MFKKIILIAAAASLYLVGCVPYTSQPEHTFTPIMASTGEITMEKETDAMTATAETRTADEDGLYAEKTPSDFVKGAPDYQPKPDDEDLAREAIFIDAAELILLKASDDVIMVQITGSLPTPCNQLRLKVHPPDGNNRIVLEAYSLVEPGMICAQVLAPLHEKVKIDLPPGGASTSWLDDHKLGEVTVP